MKVFKHPYRHYDRLMEISFWISAVWLTWQITRTVWPESLHLSQTIKMILLPIRTILWIAFNVNILLAIFVITARFMRDEHAERIWQQTARRFVNFMMVGPLVVTILAVLNSKRVTAAIPGMLPPRLLELLASEDQPAIVFFSGISATFLVVSLVVPQLFVIFYKWHQWRDGA